MTKQEVKIYTDGSCLGNPGPGGWCFIRFINGWTCVRSGNSTCTTNNRMELTAVISGLKSLTKPSNVEVITDSNYVKDAFTEKRLLGWISNGWLTKAGRPVKNRDLWEELHALAETHNVTWRWVHGHSGDAVNDACDRMARFAARGNSTTIDKQYDEGEPL